METYKPSHNIDGWYWSEKLDGCRFEWTGSELLTRTENIIDAPSRLIATLPAGVPVSGEIFGGHGTFPQIVGAVRQGQSHAFWSEIRLVAFDLPGSGLDIEAMVKAMARLDLERIIFSSVDDNDPDVLMRYITDAGGEGIVLRSPCGQGFLKHKPHYDCEAVVLERVEGKASVLVEDIYGVEFALGVKGHRVRIGQTVTVSYMSRYKSGVPRQPVFVAVRDYEKKRETA